MAKLRFVVILLAGCDVSAFRSADTSLADGGVARELYAESAHGYLHIKTDHAGGGSANHDQILVYQPNETTDGGAVPPYIIAFDSWPNACGGVMNQTESEGWNYVNGAAYIAGQPAMGRAIERHFEPVCGYVSLEAHLAEYVPSDGSPRVRTTVTAVEQDGHPAFVRFDTLATHGQLGANGGGQLTFSPGGANIKSADGNTFTQAENGSLTLTSGTRGFTLNGSWAYMRGTDLVCDGTCKLGAPGQEFGSLQLKPLSSRPTCNAQNEFTVFPTAGTIGTPSKLEVCLMSSIGTYDWVNSAIGGGS